MKFLIVLLNGPEEVIFSTPIIRVLKSTYPEAQIDYLSPTTNHHLLEANPYLSQLRKQLEPGEAASYQAIIDLEGSRKSAATYRGYSGRVYKFDPLRWTSWLLTTFQKNRLPNQHLTDRYFEVVAPLNIKPDALGLDYFIPEQDQVPLSWLPQLEEEPFVVFSLLAAYPTRQLTLNRMIELCDKMNKPVLLLGSEAEQDKAQAITTFFNRIEGNSYEEGLKDLGKRTRIINGCGKFNFNQQASLIKQARYVFCHDSPHLAVASAFQKQIFSLWGNTIPEMGKYPYRSRFLLFEKKGLSCRPCSASGYNACPKGHFKCINGITFDFYLP